MCTIPTFYVYTGNVGTMLAPCYAMMNMIGAICFAAAVAWIVLKIMKVL